MEAIIEARAVCREFGLLRALDNLQFELRRGQCLGIAGGIGSGKTTLARLLGALIPPSAGELFVLNLNSRTNASAIRAKIGMMPEKEGLDRELNTLDNLRVFGNYFGINSFECLNRSRSLLRSTHLDEWSDWSVRDLNPAQRRRLAFARALINQPEVLIMDSPARDLARPDQELIWQLIERQRQVGQSMVVVSRDLEELERLCDNIIFLDRGKIICQGKPGTLIQQHIGQDVVEYDVASGDVSYHLHALGGQYQYQLLNDRLKIFIPPSTEALTALRFVPSPRVVLRRAGLRDVFTKLLGHDIDRDHN
jgi:lipooligosaccharide transport system ATP-binding protein